ncbi:MAG: methyl-accepting chemotaxis protein [Rhodopila sp.]
MTSISTSAERQSASATMVGELEKQAANIGEIVKAVARIADQTNLLALNAAIEAARAGQHGKGFAVVADKVRTLAETSEKSAREIQALVGEIQGEVKVIAEGINRSAVSAREEVEKGKIVNAQLEQARLGVVEIARGSQAITTAALQANDAAKEAEKGSQQIAAAAAEQAAACEESLKTLEQQESALSQSQTASEQLSTLAEELKNSTDLHKSAEEVASAAEELSAAVQEISSAASQIMTAITEIGRGAQQSAAASHQCAAAIGQIEQSAKLAQERAQEALGKVEAITALMRQNRASMDDMIAGVSTALEETRRGRTQVGNLEQVSRRIDKIVDAITTVSIQTNMLAVNGSIEAARAGEFGKGFAVVSTDIRNLARDSAENAERIKDLVKATQDQIVAVRQDLEQIAAAAEVEVEKNKAISTNLGTVEQDVGMVQTGNREILQGADLILRNVQEVLQGAQQIAAAAEQSNRASTEASAGAKQQSRGAEELAAAVEEISSLADELQSSND